MLIEYNSKRLESYNRKVEPVEGIVNWCNDMFYRVTGNSLSYQQLETLRIWNSEGNQRVITKGYRTCGLTTLMMLCIAYKITHPQGAILDIVYVTDRLCSTVAPMELLMEILDKCDDMMVYEKRNKELIRFSKLPSNYGDVSSDVYVRFTSAKCSPATFALKPYDSVYMDNAAYFEKSNAVNELITGLVCNSTSKTVIGSTPGFKSGLFYNIYDSFGFKGMDFKRSSLKWYLDPRFTTNLRCRKGDKALRIGDGIGEIFDAIENGFSIVSNESVNNLKMMGDMAYSEFFGKFNGAMTDRLNKCPNMSTEFPEVEPIDIRNVTYDGNCKCNVTGKD